MLVERKQPEGFPAYHAFMHRIGKSKRAKLYRTHIPARLTVAINRYNCGMTVGHGWYERLSHTDQPGDTCYITGFFEDGSVTVGLPCGGNGRLSKSDVEVTEWPETVTAEERAAYEALTPDESWVLPNGDMFQRADLRSPFEHARRRAEEELTAGKRLAAA